LCVCAVCANTTPETHELTKRIRLKVTERTLKFATVAVFIVLLHEN
jgi:hypothetical protein